VTQIVPDHFPHAPAPSHMPLSPQLAGVSCGHSLSGSVPIETARQRPFVRPVFGLLHARHEPVQADSQQTPSTQKPLAHSPAAPQAAPNPCAPVHDVPEQKLLDAQSALDAHDVLHDVAPHR
jgi:hypothetical protein